MGSAMAARLLESRAPCKIAKEERGKKDSHDSKARRGKGAFEVSVAEVDLIGIGIRNGWH